MKLASRMSQLGTESAFEVLAKAQELAASGKDVINLAIGQPDFRTPDHIVKAGMKALEDGHHGYTAANGLLELRQAVAADLAARHQVEINPENVTILPGGKPAMFFAISMFGEADAEIIYPNPGFPIYESVIRYSGATPVPMILKEENGFAFSADEVLAQITERTRLIIINSPANPTGGVTPREEIKKFAQGLARFPQVAVFSDEIYSQLLYNELEHVSMLQFPEIRDRLIVLDGWSKTYAMTGWRLGYAVWPDTLLESAMRLCVNDHSCVNASAQYAGLAALRGPKDDVDKMVSEFDARRQLIVNLLNEMPGVSCVEPLGAFYAFPNIKGTGMTSRELQDMLLKRVGVATIAGTSFGEFGEGFLRISYANSAENIRLAADRIRSALSD